MSISPTLQAELEAAPPCDRCNASALVIVAKAELKLAFCGHHYGQHEPMLAASGWGVVADVRAPLITREKTRRGWFR